MKTHFPRVGGQQWVSSEYRPPLMTIGNAIYCDSVNGTATGPGFSPESAYSTLITAMGGCTASNDDVVFVAAGHTESVTAAAGMTFSKAGIRWEGRGVGRNRPTITFSTSTAAQIIISGANQTFRNFIFDFTGIDAIVAAISITAADVAFEDCEFICNNATAGVVLGILTAATADRLRIERCRFLGVATNSGTTTTAQIKHEVGVDYVIRDCYFTGKMTQAILNATTNLRGLIDSNRFVISTGTVAMTMAAASTPFIANNRINVPSGTAPIVAAAGFVAGNVYSAAAGVTAGTASTI